MLLLALLIRIAVTLLVIRRPHRRPGRRPTGSSRPATSARVTPSRWPRARPKPSSSTPAPIPAKADHCLTAARRPQDPLAGPDPLPRRPRRRRPRRAEGPRRDRDRDHRRPRPAEWRDEVTAWASAAASPPRSAAAGEHRRFGPVSWDVLWPDPTAIPPTSARQPARKSPEGRHQARASPHSGEEGSGPNNSSVVLQVTVATRDGPVRLLLTGDIEPPSQAAILAAHPDLAADVLKVPHHGSAHQDPDLFAAVHPTRRRDLGRQGQHLRPSGAAHHRSGHGRRCARLPHRWRRPGRACSAPPPIAGRHSAGTPNIPGKGRMSQAPSRARVAGYG